MSDNMFCFQCEQTASQAGCTGCAGVCGKSASTSKLQDELTGTLMGLAKNTTITEMKKSQNCLSRDYLLRLQM